MTHRIFIVYSSPAGTTQHVAQVIEDTLANENAETHVLNLRDTVGQAPQINVPIDLLKNAGPDDLLLIGSPVYRDVAVPPIMQFIDSLPMGRGCWGVPFVTWGAAFSGIALWQMGQALEQKGYRLAGGIKVLAVHSLMWTAHRAAGQGHPDRDDDDMVRTFTRAIYTRLTGGKLKELPLAALDYNLKDHTASSKAKLGQPWLNVPKTVTESQCTQCGLCAEECPAAAISLSEYPLFGETCFDCFNCIRLCPEAAIVPAVPLNQIHANILKRVDTFKETPPSEVFLP